MIVLRTQDRAVVAHMADLVAGMYAGQVIESGTVDDIFYRSSHPYTLGLKEAMPSNTHDRDKSLSPILGSPPDLFKPPVGCGYCARCPYAMTICAEHLPTAPALRDSPEASCWLHHPTAHDMEELRQMEDQDAG